MGAANVPVNVNTASLESLRDDVSGIGPVLAARIVAYREEHGPFAGLADLAAIQGIGPRWLERMGPQLTVGVQAGVSEIAAPNPTSAAPSLGGDHVDAPTQKAPPTQAVAVVSSPHSAEPEALPLASLDEELPELARVMAQSDELEEPAMQATPESPEKVTVPEAVSARQVPPPRPEAAPAPQRMEPTPTPAAPHPAPLPARQTRSRRWRSVLLVLLGALGGALLTLAILVAWSGTLSYTPRREFDALSANVDTMQRNQDVAWQRLDELTVRAETLEREIPRLNALDGRLTEVEKSLGATQAALTGMQSTLTTLGESIDTLRRDVTGRVDDLDRRASATEEGLSTLSLTVDELQNGVSAVQERVSRYDAFFGALRDLLADLESPAETAPDTP
jgi:competence protein ComEA